MAIQERRTRERETQRRLITSTARRLAEEEGWDAVTTRRLSSEIEYSQPVLYKHFSSRDDLAEAIALEGFTELAEALGQARHSASPDDVAGAAARAYGSFAANNPALYDVMFTHSTRLHFGADDTAGPLSQAYSELHAAVAPLAGEHDVDTLAEVFWSALHGLVMLDRSGRLRPGGRDDRIELLVARFAGSSTT